MTAMAARGLCHRLRSGIRMLSTGTDGIGMAARGLLRRRLRVRSGMRMLSTGAGTDGIGITVDDDSDGTFAARRLFQPDLFHNRTALVTGGATGIGFAIAADLLALGVDTVIASRNEDRLARAADALRAGAAARGGSAVHALTCNIRDEGAVERVFGEASEALGGKPVDFLVNNGGGQFPSRAEDIGGKGWHAVVETNLTGTFYACREFHRHRATATDAGDAVGGRGNGAVVNIICDMWNGFPGMAHTGAARAGVDNLTKSLAVEWADAGIRVNAVAPGVIYSDTAAANYADKNMFQKAVSAIPAARLGAPSEGSAAVCFLLSPGAAYVTGTTLRVDGGCPLTGPVGFRPVPHHDNFEKPPNADADAEEEPAVSAEEEKDDDPDPWGSFRI